MSLSLGSDVLSLWTSNVKDEIERKFSKSKIFQIMTFKGPGDHGMESYDFLLKKAHPCVKTRRLSHFAWRSVGGLTLRAERGKSLKVSDSHGNDVSPLSQGLNYRLVCDVIRERLLSVKWPAFSHWQFRFFDDPITKLNIFLLLSSPA